MVQGWSQGCGFETWKDPFTTQSIKIVQLREQYRPQPLCGVGPRKDELWDAGGGFRSVKVPFARTTLNVER